MPIGKKACYFTSVLVCQGIKSSTVPPCQTHHSSPAFKHVEYCRLLGIHIHLPTNKCVVPIDRYSTEMIFKLTHSQGEKKYEAIEVRP